jgi:hypothetical protein
MSNAAQEHTTPDMSLSNQLSSIKHVFKTELDIINLNLWFLDNFKIEQNQYQPFNKSVSINQLNHQ